MSIKLRILIPLAVILVVGVISAAWIGGTALLSANATAEVVGKSLRAIDDAARVDDAVLRAANLVGRVTAMTTLIPAEEISVRFAAEIAEIEAGLAGLEQEALTGQMRADVEALSEAIGTWRATAEVLLGLVPADEVPTLELMGRHHAALAGAVEVIEARAHRDAEALTAAANQAFVTSLGISGAILAAVLAVMAVFSYRTVARVGRDLHQLSGVMRELADGRLEVDVPGSARRDELGAMAGAVEVFRDALVERERLAGEQSTESGLRAERARALAEFQDKLAEVLDRAAAGDFTGRLEVGAISREFHAFAERVNGMLDTVGRALVETGEVLSALADTDLTRRVEGDYAGSFAELKSDTNKVADRLTEIVGSLKKTSGALKVAAGEILSGANDLSQRTNKQSATIQETSGAMARLAATVTENAQRAKEASVVAGSVSQTADEGGVVMSKATEAMERISASSAKISNIIGLIDDIAFQTNLLALNASVEAARAGEAGKGFAVVAVEVRRLAQSAAEASSEVKALIEQSAGEVKTGSKLVADAAEKLGAMLTAARSSNQLMDGIARQSGEQASSIEGVSEAVRQLDEMTQHNAALVEETNASIEQTEAQASELDRIVAVFTTDVEDRAAPPGADVSVRGIRALQARVSRAARSYLTDGNAALKDEWAEF